MAIRKERLAQEKAAASRHRAEIGTRVTLRAELMPVAPR